MKNLLLPVSLALLTTPFLACAQSDGSSIDSTDPGSAKPMRYSYAVPDPSGPSGPSDPSDPSDPSASSAPHDPSGLGGGYATRAVAPAVRLENRPFSRIAVGASLSALGPGIMTGINVSRHIDVRTTANLLNYSTTFNTNGFNVNAKLNFASAGASVDYYPFHWGLRLSPGLLFYNQNRLAGTAPVTPGTGFTLNNETFYSAYPNAAKGITPLLGTGSLKFNATRPAFTMTTGVGNLIPRSGKRWSIPFEIGAAFTGSPQVNMSLTGWACFDQAQTLCTDVTDLTNPIAVQIQSDLQTQLTKWRNDLEPLKVYPILSVGAVYNFNILR